MLMLTIENNSNIHFSQHWDSKILHTVLIAIKEIIIIYINNINPIYRCLFVIPESCYGPLTFRMHYHWSVDRHNVLQLTTDQLF